MVTDLEDSKIHRVGWVWSGEYMDHDFSKSMSKFDRCYTMLQELNSVIIDLGDVMLMASIMLNKISTFSHGKEREFIWFHPKQLPKPEVKVEEKIMKARAFDKFKALDKGHTIIGTKWLFRNKIDENRVACRNKARLAAQGYNQQEGIDYDETCAPVARLESVRILLAYACCYMFKLFQMDVKSAFLNTVIDEEVYVAQPLGFVDFQKPNHVYKLKMALYGLKQAPTA
nr:retrovirus-related Pol polyprotein from transposon TNT 1-94 [Tanacetum cinerariifolium]